MSERENTHGSFSLLTLPTYNSCTRCVGSFSTIHDRSPDCHPVSSAWMTSQLNVALIRKPLIGLAYFFGACHPSMFVQPGNGRRPVDWCRNWMSELYSTT